MTLAERAKAFFRFQRPVRRLGQNFMIDEPMVNYIANAVDVAGKTVLEVGPGLGFLTEKLAAKAKAVVAFEKDERFRLALERLPSNVQVNYGDVLKSELPEFDICVSNLPYQISSPFTFALLGKDFEKAVLTYQLEFAQRLIAKPGKDFNRLAATAAFLADAKLLRKVPRQCFWPIPEVDSAVVSLSPKRRPENWVEIKRTIDRLFMHPRKKVGTVFKNCRIKPSLAEKRPATVTLEEIVELTTLL